MVGLAEKFVGTWKLVSYEVRAGDQVVYPFGQDPDGYLIYTDDGYMAVAFMPSTRRRFASNDMMGATTEEKVAAADAYFSYCGKYEVADDKVIHLIKVSLYPNWIGQQQERFYKFEGELLILSTPPVLFDGKQQSGCLIWKKIQ